MAEWLKAAVLKTVVALRLPGVRIPLSLQSYICNFILLYLLSVFFDVMPECEFFALDVA